MTGRAGDGESRGCPRIARAVVRLVSLPEDRSLILADLDERFRAIESASGRGRARLWYWGQAIRSVPAGALARVDTFRTGGGGGSALDFRRTLRGFRRHPLHALGVVGTMGMGIASIATVLSITWTVWLSPLPVPDPDHVVRVFEVEPLDESGLSGEERGRSRVSPPLLEDMRSREWATLTAVGGVSRNLFDWQTERGVQRIRALVASPEAVEVLGLIPHTGRSFSDDPEVREIVLTEPFWESAFGAAPGVVGSAMMTLNGERHAVVGVVALPAGYPGDADVLTTLRWSEDDLVEGMRGARYLDVIARVRPERSVADAAAEIDTWISGLGDVHPNHAGWGGDASVLADELLAPYRDVLGLLLAAGALFLALALSNVVGLVAARSMDGRRDRAVRLALGASEGQLLRASAIDGGVIGAVAAVAALGATAALMGPVRALVPAEIPRAELIGLDAGLAAVLAMVAIVAGFGVGALGYLLSRDTAPVTARSAHAEPTHSRGRSWIVAGQVALTTVLATTGFVVISRMVELQGMDLGFEPDGVVVAPINLAGGRYPTPEARLAFWDDLLDRTEGRGLPVTFGTSSPMAGVNMPWGYRRDPEGEQAFAQYHIVESGYFRTLGIEVLEGREFTPDDRGDAPEVVVVNRRFAERNFPGQSAIGREVQVVSSMRTIVGVVESVRHFGPDRDAPEEIYAPYGQDPWPHAQLLLAGDASALNSAVVEVFGALDPELNLPPLQPYGRYVADWFAAIRLQVIVVGLLALVGTLLATLGLYALVAWRVSARRREIGIRLALGASDRRMFGDVVLRGVALALVGIVIGCTAWFLLASRITLLVESSGGTVRAPLLVGVLVAVVSLVACAIPASRSVTVDPALTLRSGDS